MMGGREFYVVEFKDPPVLDLDRYICVPSSWISRPFQDVTPRSPTVVVKYPLEKLAATKARVKKFEDYEDHWKMYIASVKYKSDNYKDAMAYIKLLNKSAEGFEPRSNSGQNEARSTNTGQSNTPEGSPSESARTKKSAPKRKYNRESQNRSNFCDDTYTEHEPAHGDTSTCETVPEDVKTLKQNLLEFFNKFLPIVERFESNIAQNSVVLEKILTIVVDKFNRPNIDETLPTTSKDRDNGNIAKTVQGNNTIGIDGIATTSKNTTPTAAAMEEIEMGSRKDENNAGHIEEPKTNDATTTAGVANTAARNVETVDRFATNIEQHSIVLEKILTILVNKFDRPHPGETIPTVSMNEKENNVEERENENTTRTIQENSDIGINKSIATAPDDTPLVTEAMEVEEVETRSGMVENASAINNEVKIPQTGAITRDDTMSERHEPVDDADNAPTTSTDTREVSSRKRLKLKRTLPAADANVPMKKRDGPRNPTLQNSQNVSEISSNDNTESERVGSVALNNQEVTIPQNFITFIYDALNVSALYNRK